MTFIFTAAIAFHAKYNTMGTIPEDTVVLFDDVDVNIGNGYFPEFYPLRVSLVAMQRETFWQSTNKT